MKILSRLLDKLISTKEVEEIRNFKDSDMTVKDDENDVDFKALEILTIMQSNISI